MTTKRRRLTKIRVTNNNSTIIGEDNLSKSTSFNTNEGRDDTEMLDDRTLSSSPSQNLNSGMSAPYTTRFDEVIGDDVDVEMGEPSVKRRGPTILADVWNLPPDQKYVVQFNREGQPYGAEAGLLAGFIGTIGRNTEIAPQGYSDWRVVPKEYKIKCMNEIKLRFEFPRNGDDHVLKSLGRAVKEFRGELKAMYYEPNKHNRASLVNAKPSRVPKDQWLKLISYWCQDKTKRRASINRNNQKNQTMPHCAGRQSFAQIRAKMTINGVEPSRAQVFIETHKDRKTRDKKKIDVESAKAVELMKEKLQALPNGVEQMDGKIAWKGDIFDQVIGKEENGGRVRGVGGGVCATKLWGESSNNEFSNLFENNDSSKEFAEKLLNDVKVMQQKYDADVKAMQEKHDEEMRVAQEKRDMEIQEVRETQSRLESHISKLVNLFIQKTAADNSKKTFYNEDVTSDTSG